MTKKSMLIFLISKLFVSNIDIMQILVNIVLISNSLYSYKQHWLISSFVRQSQGHYKTYNLARCRRNFALCQHHCCLVDRNHCPLCWSIVDNGVLHQWLWRTPIDFFTLEVHLNTPPKKEMLFMKYMEL